MFALFTFLYRMDDGSEVVSYTLTDLLAQSPLCRGSAFGFSRRSLINQCPVQKGASTSNLVPLSLKVRTKFLLRVSGLCHLRFTWQQIDFLDLIGTFQIPSWLSSNGVKQRLPCVLPQERVYRRPISQTPATQFCRVT